jgi:hypothetical protein
MALSLAVASSAIWTCVGVHIVTRNDVNTHVRWIGCRTIGPLVRSLPSLGGHVRFATTVMEQIVVSTAKVSIGHTVDHVVETRLAQTNPGRIVKHTIGKIVWHTSNDSERYPEYDEGKETVEIRPS